MKHIPKTQRRILAVLIGSIFWPSLSFAAQLNLSDYPAGTAYKAPIPNVILSIDTSGSMTRNNDNQNRITAVKNGLNATLVNSTKYEDQFRLAWQSFACNGIPSSSGGCGGKNAIAKFSGTHKSNFGTWVSQLSATGSTPSPMLIYNAGEYLRLPKNDPKNPWNSNLNGTTVESNQLACRRSYHIFLTDGGWNYKYSDSLNTPYKTGMQIASWSINARSEPNNSEDYLSGSMPMQNADGNTGTTFPDGTAYDVNSTNNQTRIYRDNFGATDTRTISSSTKYSGSGSSTIYTWSYVKYAYPTMADMAFYYWMTDLQPDIDNEVNPKIRKTGQETFTNNSRSVTYDEYWNPRNDPASWQHMVQYTIGYGSTASSLPQVNTTSPQWTGGAWTKANKDADGMYGVGFSSLAVGNTYWDDVTSTTADTNRTGGYDQIRPQEMYHMAINSRGKFYPVSGGDLTDVFADIFDDIIVDTTAPITGFTSASGSVSRVGTQSYQTSYIAAADPNSNDNRWYGYVTSDSISTAGVSTPNPAWGLINDKNKTTADILGEITTANLTNRLILSYNILSTAANKGISFKWANLSNSTATPTAASQQMWLNNGTAGTATSIAGDGNGSARVDFLRGDRTREARNTGGIFRNRKSRQGDIVNSLIWYVGPPSSGYTSTSYSSFTGSYKNRLPMVYVGGNDGMLHGFSTENGSEKIAYVPHGVIQNLSKLTDTNYNPHRYFVDGSPFSGDLNLGTEANPDWRTYLVGTLAAGGRGYFVLDVTKPGSKTGTTNVTNSFTETNAANLVVMDKTAAPSRDASPPSKPADPNADADIGHIFGNPVVAESNQQRSLQITQTNNGRWALITGNGYNSVNERPVLLIQYLDGDKSLKKITAASTGAEASSNGLSTPQFLDVNADGIPDFVYAGDLRGNMWKFDISSVDATNWGVAFDGNPLFTANYTSTSGSSSRQPITAPPVLRTNTTVGGLNVAFGTGQNLTESDRTDTSSVHTVYSILDNTRYNIATTGDNKGKVRITTSNPTPSTVSGRSALVSQSVTDGTDSGTAGASVSEARSFWKLTSQAVAYACDANATNCTAKKGWYMDLPVGGERVTTSFDFYDGSNILEIISEKPASGSATASGEEVCAPQPQAAKTFRTLINIASGVAPTPPIMDVNGDGSYTSAEAGYARMTASTKELRFSTRNQQIRRGNDGKVDKLAGLPQLLTRPAWRQLK